MSFRPKLVLIAALGVLISGAPVVAGASVPELAGVTTIHGSGYVDVHLSRAVTVSIRPTDAAATTYSISGGDKAAGVLIRQLGVPDDVGVNVMAVRFAPSIFCHATCTAPAEFLPVTAEHAAIGPGVATLPAGDYRLFALSDGPAAHVTLRLPELTGETELEPTHTTSMQAVVFTRRDAQAADNITVLGGGGQLKTAGALFDTYMSYSNPHVATLEEQCWYGGIPAGPFAFYPGCPATNGDSLEYFSEPAPNVVVKNGPYYSAGYSFARGAPGTYSTGGSLIDASSVQSVGWAAFFVSFDGQPITANAP